MRPSMRFACLFVFLLLCLSFFYTEHGSATTTFTVNDTGDTQDAALDGTCADSNSKCTLRAAIQEANNVAGTDTINIKATGIIQLTGALPGLSSDLDINGPGARLLSVRGEGPGPIDSYRIFTVVANVTVNISGLTVTNGHATDGTTGLNINGDHGGGIRNDGTLTLTGVTVSGNGAGRGGGDANFGGYGGSGGGIYNNSGTLTVSNGTITSNVANNNSGGGIGNSGGGSVTIKSSIVAGNAGGGAPDIGGTVQSDGFNSSGTSTAPPSTRTRVPVPTSRALTRSSTHLLITAGRPTRTPFS